MSKLFKRIISVILCISVVISAFIFIDFPGTAATSDGTGSPLICVQGSGMPLFVKDENGEEQEVYPVKIPDGFVEKTVKENIGILPRLFLLRNGRNSAMFSVMPSARCIQR